MNRSGYEISFDMSQEAMRFIGVLQGAGAAIPVIPTTVLSTTSSKLNCAASNNFIQSATRAGVGSYTATLKDSCPVALEIGVSVWGPNGTRATISDYNPTTRVVTFLTWAAGGAAADLAATECVRFLFSMQNVVPAY